MSKDIGLRIDELIKSLKIKKVRFAEQLGIDQSYVTQLTNGRRTPSDLLIGAICREFKVREEWLKNGIAPMFEDEPVFDLGEYVRQRGASDLETQILKAYFDLDKNTRQKLLDHFKSRLASMPEGEKVGGETVAEAIAETVYFVVPGFIAAMSAGTGQPAESDYPGNFHLIKEPPRGTSFIARVSGDSMEPTFHDGDMLFIRSCVEIEPGQIGVFFMDGQQWVKELGNGVLISHNDKKYDPVPMREDIKCQGLVLGVCDESYFE